MTYQPQPVDTSKIELASDIHALTEKLSEHAHEIWARQRIADGWSLGPTRDDEAKQHPCLVPYDQLSETEKQYDRNAALETLKVIQALGYHIVSPLHLTASSMLTAAQTKERCEQLLARLRAAQGTPEELPVLMHAWSERTSDESAWHSAPDLSRLLGRRFLKLGVAPLAKEVVRSALDFTISLPDRREVAPWVGDVQLNQILALALARTGNPDDAQKVLRRLYDAGHTDEETLGLLARTYKDQAFQTIDLEVRRKKLETSLTLYREAYLDPSRFWSGINVAMLERLLGRDDAATEVARRVQSECAADLLKQREKGATGSALYWHLATIGEAALNLGDIETAGRHYQDAHAAAPRNFADLNSTRRHARWLIEHWIKAGRLSESDTGLLDQWLPLPTVVVFAGHMLDQVGRNPERFPARLADGVKQTIKDWLIQYNGLIGFSSGACGADLLFQEAIQELGGESRIVLPFDAEEFKATSVSYAGDEWSQRFDEVLGRARVVTASPQRVESSSISYEYANLVLHGLSTVRAVELQTRQMGLVVWDRKSGDGPGGTASVVQQWRTLGLDVDCVDLSTLPTDSAAALTVIRNPEVPDRVCVGPECEVSNTHIMAMLFGDAVNFSKLTEAQVPRFVQHFLGSIGEIVQKYGEANVVRNTWGDGLYLVFKTVRDAGLCALDICDFMKRQIEQKRWSELGLPNELSVRLALHAGPVFGCVDPITNQTNYTGTHVSRAARLEPKTPPGEVYASEAFAALCMQSQTTEFSCEYVKQLEWAKHYGTFPTFVLRRR